MKPLLKSKGVDCGSQLLCGIKENRGRVYRCSWRRSGKEAGRKLVAELEADVLSIDDVLAFFESDAGEKHLARNRRRLMRHMPGK